MKVGDRVRCVDAAVVGGDTLKKGEIYTTTAVITGAVRIEGSDTYWHSDRFEVVTDLIPGCHAGCLFSDMTCECQKPRSKKFEGKKTHPHHHTRDAHPGNRHLEQRKEFERLVLKSLAVLLASDAEADWHFNLVKDIKNYEKDHLK